MEVCEASVQGAVVPSSEYAFAALTCCVLSVSSLCVLPDFALGSQTNLACRDTLAICPRPVLLGVQQRFGAAAAFRIRILSGLANAGREK